MSAPSRYGVWLEGEGARACIPSKHADAISLCVFDGDKEHQRIALTRAGENFIGQIPNMQAGHRYGLRVSGPAQHLFDDSKLLIDPWAREIDGPFAFDPRLTQRGVDTAGLVPKCVLTNAPSKLLRHKARQPDWIYELNVKAFTMRHPDVPAHLRGTVRALAEPAVIDHFVKLGVDTIELMPLAAWIDERHLHAIGLSNAWGYNPVTFMAPEPRLAPGGIADIAFAVAELRKHGIQAIVDVVLNHSGESDLSGPTLSMRGLDNPTWYRHANGTLVNDTGCGNTIDLTQDVVVDYALASLRHWVEATGIVGFRFDLATVMGRLPNGFHADAPLLKAIENDPVLSQCLLIAEPWDIGPGGYQLGQFPKNWPEWNDKYRDDVRRFWRGDHFSANAMATRITGSSDIFSNKSPRHSINFISAHDGFTLADLTQYATKNNLANGENNRDGKSDEVTCVGLNPDVLLATLFLSRGTPMLTAGDEFGRSQNGNNNAYAQDNDTTWLQWKDRNTAREALVAELVKLRRAYPQLASAEFVKPSEAFWFNADGAAYDWSNGSQGYLGLCLTTGDQRVAMVFGLSPTAFPLPAINGKLWTLQLSVRDENLAGAVYVFVEA